MSRTLTNWCLPKIHDSTCLTDVECRPQAKHNASSGSGILKPKQSQNILNTMPGKKEFIRGSEAEAFAEELARDVKEHPEKEPAG